MLRDHRPLLVTFADKAAVRDYVAARVGEEYLPRAYAVLSDPDDLLDVELPDVLCGQTHPWQRCRRGGLPRRTGRRPGCRRPVAPGSTATSGPRPSTAAGSGTRRRLARPALRPRTEQGVGVRAGPPPDPGRGAAGRTRTATSRTTTSCSSSTSRCASSRSTPAGSAAGPRTSTRPDWERLDLSGGPAWAPEPQPRPDRLDEMIGLAETLGGGDRLRPGRPLPPARPHRVRRADQLSGRRRQPVLSGQLQPGVRQALDGAEAVPLSAAVTYGSVTYGCVG